MAVKRNGFWHRHWQERAGGDDHLVISGWGKRDIKEYLFDLHDIYKKLELNREDKLLNIGCGNGLFEIATASWLKKIDSIDFSRNMLDLAKENNRHNRNVRFYQGNILDLSFLKERYSKVLVNSVIQYLNSLEEVEAALQSIKKICAKRTKILIAANPDLTKQEEFLSGYDRLNIPEEEKQRKKAANKKSLWTNPGEVLVLAEKNGFKGKILPMDKRVWQACYMYDLLLSKE